MSSRPGMGQWGAPTPRPWSLFLVVVLALLSVVQYRSVDFSWDYAVPTPMWGGSVPAPQPMRVPPAPGPAPSVTATNHTARPHVLQYARPNVTSSKQREKLHPRVAAPRPVRQRGAPQRRQRKSFAELEAELLRAQEALLEADLAGYSYHPALHDALKGGLVPADGGVPVRNLIISTWRSGSSFLGSVVQAHPATFYFFEPFMPLKTSVQAHPHHSPQLLQELFQCNFTGKNAYFSGLKKKSWALKLNSRYWRACSARALCFSSTACSDACRRFPFLAAKTVRFRLRLVEPLLHHETLGLRVLLLVRDPRGSMASRYRATSWCMVDKDCSSVDTLCGGLLDDYTSALRLAQLYPDSVRVVRYEDLMLDPYTITRQIYDFFRLTYGAEVHKLLQREDHYSPLALRRPRRGLHYWTQTLSFSQVSTIQQKCAQALDRLGYRPALNTSHLRSLNPLAPLPSLLPALNG